VTPPCRTAGARETDLRRDRIVSLAEALRGAGFTPSIDPDEPQLTIPGQIIIRCERRASDDGRLWYLFVPGRPIAEADDQHLAAAIATISARIGAVTVDLCARGVDCGDLRCRWRARLIMRVGEEPPRYYCVDCMLARLRVHKTRREQIVWSRAARDWMDSQGQRVVT
jgi:hypothetical protein